MMWHVEEMSPMILQKPATWEEAVQLFFGGIDVYPDHTEANQAEANSTAANQTTVYQVGVSKVGMNQSGESNHTQAASDLEMFEKYLEADTDFDLPERGDLREGVIVEIRPNEWLVNVGSKRDGVIPSALAIWERRWEVMSRSIKRDVVISKPPEDDSTFQLSMADALQQRDAQELLENGNIITRKVIGYNKSVLVIEFQHLKGFVPASHVIDMPRNMSEDQRRSELEGYSGSEMRLKVIEVDRHRRRLVMSQMLAEREYRDQPREQLLSTLRERDWITSPGLYDSSRLLDYESAVCHLLESRDKTKQQLEDDLRHPFLLVLDGLDEIPQSYSPERDALRTLAALLSRSILTLGDSNIYAHEQSLLWRRSVQAIGSKAGLERWQDADLHIVHFSGHGDATDGAMYLPCPGGAYSWSEGTPHRLWYCNGGKNQSCMRDNVGFPGKAKLSSAYRWLWATRSFCSALCLSVCHYRGEMNSHAINRLESVGKKSAASHLETGIMQYTMRAGKRLTRSMLNNESLLEQSSGTSCPQVHPCGTTEYQNRQLAVILMVLVGWGIFFAMGSQRARLVLITDQDLGATSVW